MVPNFKWQPLQKAIRREVIKYVLVKIKTEDETTAVVVDLPTPSAPREALNPK